MMFTVTFSHHAVSHSLRSVSARAWVSLRPSAGCISPADELHRCCLWQACVPSPTAVSGPNLRTRTSTTASIRGSPASVSAPCSSSSRQQKRLSAYFVEMLLESSSCTAELQSQVTTKVTSTLQSFRTATSQRIDALRLSERKLLDNTALIQRTVAGVTQEKVIAHFVDASLPERLFEIRLKCNAILSFFASEMRNWRQPTPRLFRRT